MEAKIKLSREISVQTLFLQYKFIQNSLSSFIYQTDGKYWHDYFPYVLFDLCFVKHGLVLPGAFQSSMLLLNTVPYRFLFKKNVK
jgi:hypothetical protein